MFSGVPEVLNLNLWFVVPKTSSNHFFSIPFINHRHSTNLNFDRYGDHCQRGRAVLLRSTTQGRIQLIIFFFGGGGVLAEGA